MNYFNYEIRIAEKAEVHDALFFAMENFMESESEILGKKYLDLFINNYYMNEDYFHSAITKTNPIFCCFFEDKIIGVISLDINKENIAMWYVDKNYRCKGIGKALYRALKEYVIECVPEKDYMYVEEIERRMPFFTKFGFTKNEEGKLALLIKRPLDLKISACDFSFLTEKISLNYRLFQKINKEFFDASYLREQNIEAIRKSSEKNAPYTYRAVYDNKLVGFITYSNSNKYNEERTAEITDLFVHDEYYGYGIGEALLTKIFEVVAYKRILVHINAKNKYLIDYFKFHKFFETGKKTRELFGKREEELVELLYIKPNCNLTRMEAVEERRSIRIFDDEPLDVKTIEDIQNYVDIVNRESGLHFKIITNNPEPFSKPLNHIGRFENVHQYLAIMGPKSLTLEEQCGYFGEKLVIHIVQMGLGTCWTTLTFDKTKINFDIPEGDKLVALIPFGNFSKPVEKHKNKPIEKLYKVLGSECPQWFLAGVNAAMLGPSAMNQQKFCFSLLSTGKVLLEAGSGIYTKIDAGIAKYHFEVGTDGVRFSWKL